MQIKLFQLLILIFLGVCNALPLLDSAIDHVNDNDENAEYGGYFEGDMILNYDQMSSILYANKRNGMINEKYRWPGNVVFYELDPIFDKHQVEYIKKALKNIEEVTCIKFKPRTKATKDYIQVTGKPGGCFSDVGRQGRKQRLNLAPNRLNVGCFRLGSIMHEFIHALGFHHQQSASDRDNYVTIIKENISVGHEGNFRKYPPSIVTEFGVPYDYGSIMHYSAYAFSKNGKMTIVPHNRAARIGQRDGLSPSDIKKINLMYKCPKIGK